MICESKSYGINNGISKSLCWVALGISVGTIFSFVRAPLSFGLILGLLGLSLVAMNVKLSFYWLIGLLPFLYFIKRIDVVFSGSSTTEFNSPMSLIPETFCMVLCAYFLLTCRRNKRPIKPDKTMTRLIISLFLLSSIQIFNPNTTLSSGLMGFRYFAIPMLILPVGWFLFDRKEEVVFYMKLTAILGTIVACYGILQGVLDFPSWDRTWFDLVFMKGKEQLPVSYLAGYEFSWEEVRKFSTFSGPPPAGAFYCISALMSLGLLLNSKGVSKIGWGVALALILCGMFLTYTRGAWIGFIGGGLTVLSLHKKSRPSKGINGKILKACFLVAIVISGFFLLNNLNDLKSSLPKGISGRIISLSAVTTDQSMVGRYLMWLMAGRIILEHPLGVGMGTTGMASERTSAAYPVDNLYLKIMVEDGTVGLLIFMALLLYLLFYHSRKILKSENDPYDRNLVVVMIGIIVSLSIYGLVIPVLDLAVISIHFWFIIGLLSVWPELTDNISNGAKS